ncbi:class I SAM-dependent methyltransferase [Synechococcus elongatus]|uniref:Class I SAM-dependent methyltransferase n=1 Tax=Synechococcus elongatus PCC 11801 TaxID=2219813 RepID=A0AAN1QPT6_SYNEL|nr:class I SAM-dependent methyltransferase [Synechococcus elongatus]AZB73294.1 SAM-dependent methyltransferase [Synechococcus elongatus PCC 11801]
MGFYSNVLLPWLMDRSMADPALVPHRREILANVSGNVLEVGFGSGINLPYYPEAVTQLTTVDINPGLNAIAQHRIAASPLTVSNQVLNGESLPMATAGFDYVVSTYTLCSIAQVHEALSEIARVLKPGGQFVFLEHGLSDRPNVQRWQHRLTPLNKLLADGCHQNRNIQQLIEAHFEQVTLERFADESMRFMGQIYYKGTATKTPVAPD